MLLSYIPHLTSEEARLREVEIIAESHCQEQMSDVCRVLRAVLVHGEGRWAIGQRRDVVVGPVKEDLLEEVTWSWAVGSPAFQAAGSPRVKVVS